MRPLLLLKAFRTGAKAQARGRPERPFKLEFFLTWRCSSRCRSCSIWRRPQSPGPELSPDRVAALVRSLKGSLVWLSFTGGEVTERDDLGDVLIQAVEAGPGVEYVNLSSNGLSPKALEAQLSEFLAGQTRPRVSVTLSLDGLGPAHDRLRGVPGGFASLMETAARLGHLRERYPQLAYGFQITLSAANREAWPALSIFAHQHAGGLSPVFSPAVDGGLVAASALRVDLRRLGCQATSALEALLKAAPLRVAEDLVTRRFLRTLPGYIRRGEAPWPCAAGYASLTIEPDGQVRRCDSLDEVLGDAGRFGDDLAALLQDPEVVAAFAERPDCRQCWTPCQAYPTLLLRPFVSAQRWGILP